MIQANMISYSFIGQVKKINELFRIWLQILTDVAA